MMTPEVRAAKESEEQARLNAEAAKRAAKAGRTEAHHHKNLIINSVELVDQPAVHPEAPPPSECDGLVKIQVEFEALNFDLCKRFSGITRPMVRLNMHDLNVNATATGNFYPDMPSLSAQVKAVLSVDSYAGHGVNAEMCEDCFPVAKIENKVIPYAWDSLLEPVDMELRYHKYPFMMAKCMVRNMPSLNLVPRFFEMFKPDFKPELQQLAVTTTTQVAAVAGELFE